MLTYSFFLDPISYRRTSPQSVVDLDPMGASVMGAEIVVTSLVGKAMSEPR